MKKFLKILLRIVIVLLVVIVMIAIGAFSYVAYMRWQADKSETLTYNESGELIVTKNDSDYVMQKTVTCLFLGVNGTLTDFIMLGKYDPNTRKVNLMSIPRDTHVDGTYDGKINSAYAGVDPTRTVKQVENITGVKVEYYVLFKADVLKDIVDKIDGVTVDVPINMDYDDPYQNLHIHLKKGVQKLDGKKAEQFVRFRKNNNNTGYINGDVDRVKAQQKFIYALIARCLEPQNLVKIGDLAQIMLDNTKTNVTSEVISEYIDDAIVFKPDRVRMETLPGAGGYGENGLSYFFMDEKKAKELINELFKEEGDIEEAKQVHADDIQLIGSGEVKEFDSGKIRIEVLNNGASSKVFGAVVNLLTKSGYSVDRVGNVENDDSTLSRIINHSRDKEALEQMNLISKSLGISKLENKPDSKSEVDYTIILGPKYSL